MCMARPWLWTEAGWAANSTVDRGCRLRSGVRGIPGTTLLIEMLDVSTFGVLQLLKTQSFSIEIFKHGVDALLHVNFHLNSRR